MASIYQKGGYSVYDQDGKTYYANGPKAGSEYQATPGAAPSATAAPTLAVTPDPSATSPIGASTVRRYTASPSSTSSQISDIYSGLDITAPTADEQQKIRDQALSDVQRQLDAIDASAASQLSEANSRGTTRLGSARAINARSGVLGSDMGARRTDSVEAVNAQERNAIEAWRGAQKAAVFDKANQRAADLIAAEKDRAMQNADTYVKYLAQQQDAARSDMKALAGAGVGLDQLSDQEYKTMLDQSGYKDSLLFDAVYNASLPKNQQNDYTYMNIGNGKVIRYDKNGGEPQMFDYSVPDGYQFKMAGDIPVFVNESTQDVKVAAPGGDANAFGQYAKETELDTFTDASGNRVSVMYNPVTKKTRNIVLGKAKDTSGDGGGYPSGFKPQPFEVSAVSQFITAEGAKQGQSQDQIDEAIKTAQQDPGFFYSTLGIILGDSSYSNKYYKPTTLGIPSSVVVSQ